jgi:hypothetical protein
VDPAERAMLKNAILEMHRRFYPGNRDDVPPGHVSWWFKQDEIHQATHVHGGPEFLPWHRELTNRFEQLLRQINPQLSLHYWDFKDDPRNIPNGNIGGGNTGPVNLFDSNFMGLPGIQQNINSNGGPIGDPWLSAGFYDPQAGTARHPQDRDVSGNPVDPPKFVMRPSNYPGPAPAPLITANQENHILGLRDFGPAIAQNHQDGTDPNFVNNIKPNYFRTAWEDIHNQAHPYFANISPHDAFRDPFVFLLHSNVDRIYAMWQLDAMHPERLDPNTVYGSESNMDVDVIAVGIHSVQNLTHLVEPFSTGVGAFHSIRPWEATHENQGVPHDYHHISVVTPPSYDTNPSVAFIVGRVTDTKGNPIPGATVRVAESDPGIVPGIYTTRTDALGYYNITLYPGLYTGSYSLDAFGPDIVEMNMSLGRIPLGTTVTQNLRLTIKGSLAGFIGDASKTPIMPVAGATVTVGTLRAVSGATGRYTLTGLTPGANDVRLSASGFDTAEVSVTVVSGVVTTQNFLLVEASAVMTGTVSDSDTDDTLVGATVRIGSSSTKTNIDGTYTISGIPAGQLQVTVSAVHYVTQNELVQFRDRQTLRMDFALISQRLPGPRPRFPSSVSPSQTA